VRLNREVLSVSVEQRHYTVTLEGNERLAADAVLLCAPAPASSRILAELPEPRLSNTLAAIPYVSTATVFFGFEREPSPPFDGAGFIIPRDEGRLLASTYVSSKWGGRTPAGGALLRVFLGGTRDPELVEQGSDAELVQVARDELARFLGPIAEQASFAQTFRWVRSRPQPTRGHGARLRVIEEALERLPGLALAGAAYDGVGLSDCIRQGRAAAKRVLATLA
jgi:oxygen-dependent protoporphyrinogen oxidase